MECLGEGREDPEIRRKEGMIQEQGKKGTGLLLPALGGLKQGTSAGPQREILDLRTGGTS